MPVSIQRIMDAHGHTEEDARLWLSKCRYNFDISVSAVHDIRCIISPLCDTSVYLTNLLTYLCRYAADEHMAVDKEQMENSVRILRKVGLVPDTFATEQLWSNKAGVANAVITVN